VTGQRTRALIKRNAGSVLYVFFLSLLMMIPATAAPVFKQVFTDRILQGNEQSWLPILIALMLAMAIISAALTLLQKNCLIKLAGRIETKAQSHYFYHLLHSPLKLFDKANRSQLVTKADSAAGVSSILTVSIVAILFAIINFILYLVLMLKADAVMTAIVVALAVLSFFFQILQRKATAKVTAKGAEKGIRKSAAELNAQDENATAMGIQNISLIKSTSSEDKFFTHIMNIKVEKLLASRPGDYAAAAAPLNGLNTIIFLNLLLFISSLRIMDQSFTIGAYLAFQAYATAFFAPLNFLLGLKAQLKAYENQLKAYEEDLVGAPLPAVTKAEDGSRLSGRIEIRDVSFSYAEGGPVLKNISLSIAPGEHIAIVGKSGAGKSTLLKLLQGLYDPDSGEILFDGMPLHSISPHVRALSIGSANQQIAIYSASIGDNIALFDTSVSTEQLEKAASAAQLRAYVSKLKGAYQAPLLQDGHNLSGGQKQRLEIARALLHNPSVVLMDESMGALDPATSKNIFDNLLARGATVLMVTHTVSGIRDADRILVMENGTITDQGTHRALLKQSEYYRSLCRREGWSIK